MTEFNLISRSDDLAKVGAAESLIKIAPQNRYLMYKYAFQPQFTRVIQSELSYESSATDWINRK
jgi:hypothetical protein